MNSRLIAALALIALLMGCAHDRADDRNFTFSEPRSETYVTRYADANHDGKVTRDEAKVDPALAASFDHYDANRDGVLDHAEFARLEASSQVRNGETVEIERKDKDKERGWYGDRDPLD